MVLVYWIAQRIPVNKGFHHPANRLLIGTTEQDRLIFRLMSTRLLVTSFPSTTTPGVTSFPSPLRHVLVGVIAAIGIVI